MGEIKHDPTNWTLLLPENPTIDEETGTIAPDGRGILGISCSEIRSHGYMFVGSNYLERFENEDWFESEAIPAVYPGGGYFIRIDRIIGKDGFIGLDDDDHVGEWKPNPYC